MYFGMSSLSAFSVYVPPIFTALDTSTHEKPNFPYFGGLAAVLERHGGAIARRLSGKVLGSIPELDRDLAGRQGDGFSLSAHKARLLRLLHRGHGRQGSGRLPAFGKARQDYLAMEPNGWNERYNCA
jgi:hypothetical protein